MPVFTGQLDLPSAEQQMMMLNNNFMHQPINYSMGVPVPENLVMSPMGGQHGGIQFDIEGKKPESGAHPS